MTNLTGRAAPWVRGSVNQGSLRCGRMQRYLSLGEVAARCGLELTTVKGYLRKGILPAPDAQIGRNRGWTAETIDGWQSARRARAPRRPRSQDRGQVLQ